MVQEFYINHGSVLPYLRMELIMDGRHDFNKNKFHDAIQNADVTFSMKSTETDILKVSKASADIVPIKDDGCVERYAIQYKWKERDTKIPGIYQGWFDIKFKGTLKEDGVEFPDAGTNLIMPIAEDLIIYVK